MHNWSFVSVSDLVLLSVACGVASLTLTYTPLTAPIRHKMIGWPLMLGELANCPYCMTHWIALGLSIWIGGNLVTILLHAAIITGGGALFVGILLRLFLFREGENEELRKLIGEARKALLAAEAKADVYTAQAAKVRTAGIHST